MIDLKPLPAELADLLESYCLGELTPEQARRLEQLINESDELCRHFVRFVSMHALAERFEGADPVREAQVLEQVVEAATAAREATCGRTDQAKPDSKEQGQLQPPRSAMSGRPGNASRHERFPFVGQLTPWTIGALSATCLCLAIAVVLLVHGLLSRMAPNELAQSRSSVPPTVKIPGVESQFVARIGRLSGVRYAAAEPKLAADERLAVGRDIKLEGGCAEVDFDSGVKMTVEGPARVRILGPLLAEAFLGKIAAQVGKNGHGFSIVTPQGKVVDLGTQFGVRIDDSGREEIAVFEGQVDINFPRAAGRTAGQPGARSRVAGRRKHCHRKRNVV